MTNIELLKDLFILLIVAGYAFLIWRLWRRRK